MTCAELYEAVALLGFENALDSEETFYPALNRAVYEINRFRPKRSKIVIAHYPIKPVAIIEHAIYKKGETITLTADNAQSYTFEVTGSGCFTVERNKETEIHEWNAAESFKRFCGFCEGKIKITFSGEYTYIVRNAALFEEKKSEKKEDIPQPSSFTAYNLKAMAEDYLRLCSPPILQTEYPALYAEKYNVENDNILFSNEIEGVFDVYYETKLKKYSKNDANQELEIDEDLIQALVLLIASYVWLDDEKEKATYYKNLYNEQLSLISATEIKTRPAVYVNVDNWA